MYIRNVRAVFFDLDGTLRTNQPSWNDFINDYLAGLDGGFDSQATRQKIVRWDLYYWAQSPELLSDVEAFGEDDRAFCDHYYYRRLMVYGFPNERAAAFAAQLHQHLDETFHPQEYVADDVRPTLKALGEAGLALGLVSNRMRSIDDLLTQLDLQHYLQFTVISGEVNAWKPDPAIFEHALAKSGTRPQETVYVGDNYYADVVGARRAGLQPVLLDARRLFPEADCPIIYALGELPALLDLN
jgi:HAD superfamily hydrolase (TIGR01549 family)